MDTVHVALTANEALVLYEYLRRCDDEDRYAFVDQAEQRAVWNLEIALQPHLPVQSPDYLNLVEGARNALRDED